MTGDSSIDYFLRDTGDKILKTDEVLEHLQVLEDRAENGGFTSTEFSDLCRVIINKPFPAQLGRRFIFCLVPSQAVRGNIKLPDKSTTSYDMLDFKSYIKNL